VTWRVGVRPEAELDLLVAAGWYEAQQQGLGTAFIHELSLLVASLADNALLYAEHFEGIRRVFARRFPYAVYFLVVGDEVVVTAILHMRRSRQPRNLGR
jgi:plasmid stabilization system protein ParE